MSKDQVKDFDKNYGDEISVGSFEGLHFQISELPTGSYMGFNEALPLRRLPCPKFGTGCLSGKGLKSERTAG